MHRWKEKKEKWGIVEELIERWKDEKRLIFFCFSCLLFWLFVLIFGLTKSFRNCVCCRRWSHATSVWRADWQQPQLHRARAASVAESVAADGGGDFLPVRDGDAAWPLCYAAPGYSSLRSRCSRCCSACASTARHSLMHTHTTQQHQAGCRFGGRISHFACHFITTLLARLDDRLLLPRFTFCFLFFEIRLKSGSRIRYI
jgi:hypothetical protein